MKALRLYLPLIGVPTLALIGVLRAGQSLSAPPAVHGRWSLGHMQVEPALSGDRSATDCAAMVSADSLHRLVIAQSGPRADAELRTSDGGTWARATLRVRRGGALGTLRGMPTAPGCSGAAVLSFTFARAVPDTMLATLAWPGCATCSALRLVAVRRKRPAD